jgi:hypothetical protein
LLTNDGDVSMVTVISGSVISVMLNLCFKDG